MLRCALSGLIVASACAQQAAVLVPAPAYYPRLYPAPGASRAFRNRIAVYHPGTDALQPCNPADELSAYATMETPNATAAMISCVGVRTDGSACRVGVVAADDTPGVDLANGHLLALNATSLLCAYRHHIPTPNGTLYRIRVSASRDAGRTWAVASTVVEGSVGLWEPFLFPYQSVVRVVYSAELTNGGEQDVVVRTSVDGGATWSNETSRIHTPGSRNGMPVVTLVADSHIIVFEGFWSGAWGHFTVNSARSWDGGASWSQLAIVHAPSVLSFKNAGSPFVATCSNGSAVVVTYMSDEYSSLPGSWPNEALVAVKVALLDGMNASAPVQWLAFNSTVAPLPVSQTHAYWPSLFMNGSHPQVVYQDGAGDAVVVADAIC